jgi:hypothetical protein
MVGDLSLKGFSRPVLAYNIIGFSEPHADRGQASLLQR